MEPFAVLCHVCEAIDVEPDRYRDHSRYMVKQHNQVPVRNAVRGREQSITPQPRSPSDISFSSEATQDDYDTMNELVWTGSYAFRIDVPPELPKLGWRAGRGRKWQQDSHGRVDLLLAIEKDAKAARIHGNHALFNIIADSGAFAIKALQEDHAASLESQRLHPRDGYRVLARPEHVICLGELQYLLKYNVSEDDNPAFQAAKRRYMTDMLSMQLPIACASVTPTIRDIKLGEWTWYLRVCRSRVLPLGHAWLTHIMQSRLYELLVHFSTKFTTIWAAVASPDDADRRQFRVLVTCIFLNKTKAVQAEHLLGAFLEEYSTRERLRSADLKDIQERYFKHLGLHRRAGWLVKMADQLLRDHPRPHTLRQKTYRNAGYACEVAHLAGVGPYASDAWRLFCKKSFYAGHQIVVADEWKTLEPEDKDLRRYVERKRCEGQVRLLTDDVASRMAALQLSSASASCSKPALQPGLLIRSGDSALRVPQRLLDQARGISLASSDNADTTRFSRVVATAS
ncbi:hypothetical protein LTR75_017953 [Friedmanniomyces endolithicus]|nr:hypothetical protein LTR75_017953 [Friedmanniomyces endolithicus]